MGSGAGTATLLLGLALVLAGQTVMADEADPELGDLVDGVLEDPVETRDGEPVPASNSPSDPFALWLVSMQDQQTGVLESGETPGDDSSLEASVDDVGNEVSAVVEGSLEQVEDALDRTKERFGHKLGQGDPDDGSGTGDDDSSSNQEDEEHGGDGDGSSLQGAVCGVLVTVCDAPSPSEFVPDLPTGPPLPGLPGTSGPEAVDDPLAEGGDGPSRQPQQVAVEPLDEGGALGVALAAAAATAFVAAVAAATSTGSSGSVAAWFLRVVAGVKGFFLSLYARLKSSKVLDHATRKELFLFIQANPGSCITQIQEVLGTTLSTTRHHLDTLRSHGLVVDVKSGRKRCFFTREDGLSPKARTATAALSSKAARRVYRQIERNPGIGQQELAKALRVSRTSVIFHVRRLQDAGVVRQGQEGRQVVYHPVEDGSSSTPRRADAPAPLSA